MKTSELLIKARTALTSHSDNDNCIFAACISVCGSDYERGRAVLSRICSASAHMTGSPSFWSWPAFKDQALAAFLFDKAIAMAQIEGD
jgi:hypothetical protein